jgi:hypothetical protein
MRVSGGERTVRARRRRSNSDAAPIDREDTRQVLQRKLGVHSRELACQREARSARPFAGVGVPQMTADVDAQWRSPLNVHPTAVEASGVRVGAWAYRWICALAQRHVVMPNIQHKECGVLFAVACDAFGE